ncbi:hypothetical protein GCM10025784_25990 [Citricoccus nitrophenolicus]
MADGPGQHTGFQDFLDSLEDGDTALIDGCFEIRGATVRASSVQILFGAGARLLLSEPFEDGLVVKGDRVSFDGGILEGPGSWNGVNTPWQHAMVHVMGEDFLARDVTLLQVPKVGFGIRGAGARIRDCRITGGYPEHSWTGVETGHFGIAFDPSTDESSVLSGSVQGCDIRSCVQGISMANHGSGAAGAYSVANNSFQDCHNHGIYAQSGQGSLITGNIFIGCQVPIVVTGKDHTVSNNILRARMDSSSRDLVGINVRDAVDCMVAHNVIRGRASAESVAISLDGMAGEAVTGNVVSDNTISLEGTGRPVIRVGNNAVICEHNTVSGNSVRGGGQDGQGAIVVTATTASAGGRFNDVVSNSIRVGAAAAGILLERQIGATVRGNTVTGDMQSAGGGQGAVELRSCTKVFVEGTLWRAGGDDNDTEPIRDIGGSGNYFAGNVREGHEGLEAIPAVSGT